MWTEADKLDAIPRVVYEYANLVSAGEKLQQLLKPPLNTHVQEAFLLGCRKMADFFQHEKRPKDDVLAQDFVPNFSCSLPEWDEWELAINKQLAHITFTRFRNPAPLDGKANGPLLAEFRAAWRDFLARLEEPYRSEFERRITERQKPGSGFEDLDLR